MGKTVIKHFFDFMGEQEKWLNGMAKSGYRLKKCGRMTYTFEPCRPDEYEYAIEFAGDKSYSKAKDYFRYLESMGYRAFTKNINLNFSFGKVRWRPYAKGMGQVATSPGGYNKEFLILEKRKDGKPFELHTDVGDKLNTCKAVRRAYAWAVLSMVGLAGMSFLPGISSLPLSVVWVLRAIILFLGIMFTIPTIRYSAWISRLTEESKTFE